MTTEDNVTIIAALKPGWCILHGLQEPCWKCNAPHAGAVVSSR